MAATSRNPCKCFDGNRDGCTIMRANGWKLWNSARAGHTARCHNTYCRFTTKIWCSTANERFDLFATFWKKSLNRKCWHGPRVSTSSFRRAAQRCIANCNECRFRQTFIDGRMNSVRTKFSFAKRSWASILRPKVTNSGLPALRGRLSSQSRAGIADTLFPSWRFRSGHYERQGGC